MTLSALVLAIGVSSTAKVEEFSQYVEEAFTRIGVEAPAIVANNFSTSKGTPLKVYEIPGPPARAIHYHDSILDWSTNSYSPYREIGG